MGLEPLTATILGMFGSAIAGLFAAYTLVQNARAKSLEGEITHCRAVIEITEREVQALKEENSEYVALFVLMQAGNEHDLQLARERVAAILRRQKGYGGS